MLENWLQRLPSKKLTMITKGAIGVVGLYFCGATIYNVNAGHRALIFDRRSGLQDKIFPEGTHLKLPVLQRKIIYDIRAQPFEVRTNSDSHDFQMIDTKVRVLFRPIADQLPTIYRWFGENYMNIILPSIVPDTVKHVVAQYTASQLLSQREKVNSEIRDILKKRAATFHIVLDDVSITSLTLRREFAAAIEAKQIAAQEAARARFMVEKAEQEKRTPIVQAQARSAELMGRAIVKNPAFIALRRIEASKEISNKLLLNLHSLTSTKLTLVSFPLR